MSIIVCGANGLGLFVARYLRAEGHKLTILAQPGDDMDQARQTASLTNARLIEGLASSPDSLAECGAEETEFLLALDDDDEVNIIACFAAAKLFKVPHVTALVHNHVYHKELWSGLLRGKNKRVDTLIAPEKVLAQWLLKQATYLGLCEVETFSLGKIIGFGINISYKHSLQRQTFSYIEQICHKHWFSLVGFERDGQFIIHDNSQQQGHKDKLYLLGSIDMLGDLLQSLQLSLDRPSHLNIFGSNQLAESVIEEAQNIGWNLPIRLIANDMKNAQEFSSKYTHVQVMFANLYAPELFSELGLNDAGQVNFVLSKSEADNVLLSLLLQEHSSGHAIVRLDEDSFARLLSSDVNIRSFSPRLILMEEILPAIRPGNILKVHIMPQSKHEMLHVMLIKSSEMVGKKLEDIESGDEIKVFLIVRDGRSFVPNLETLFISGDEVFMMSKNTDQKMLIQAWV